MSLKDPRVSALALAEPPARQAEARQIDHDAVQRAARDLLRALGADVDAEALEETPRRVAEAYAELLTPQPFRATTFPNDEGYDELIVARAIPFHSLCMHHLLPFQGVAHVGYLPGERIIGLSKLGRVVEFFSRDLQIQERLTTQVADWLQRELEPKGVGVVLEAEHMCMSLRGVQKLGATTVTSALRGLVRDDARTRQEFLALTKRRFSMTSDQTHVIVGASLAGAKAAETLREEGFEGRVVLVGTEEERPYERPPLSKDYLRGEVGREKVYVHDEGFYAEHDIELRLGRTAVSLDTANTRLELDDGEQLSYDRLLLTTGSEPRRLSVPGAELDGVFYLRSVRDSDALRERLDRGGAVVVVGAGWIGAEVAASARQRGLDVTVIEPASVPLERVLGKEIGAIYRDIHTDHGVRMLTGTGVEALEGDGAVERVRTSDGRVIDCDFVVVGVGVQPRTALAAEAGSGHQQRHPRRCAASDQRARGVRRRRRGERAASLLRRADPRRALGQRAQPGTGGGPQHARRVGSLRSPAVLLLRSVRRRHGVHRPGPRLRPGRRPWRSRGAGVRRLLDVRRPRHGRHERERLGRDRPHQAAHTRAGRGQ